MFVLGIACSHAPTLLLPTDMWEETYRAMVGDVPQPNAASSEDKRTLEDTRLRLDSGIEKMKQMLTRSRPDAIVIIGDDQREVFPSWLNPALAVFCGEEISGHTLVNYRNRPGINQKINLAGSPKLGRDIVSGLIERGFDPLALAKFGLSGEEYEIGHAFARPAHFLGLAELGVPVVPLFLNMYYDPLPSGQRCYDMGAALREIIDDQSQRIAVVASGGLSHDPLGQRAGWIDQRLDRWVLDRVASGDGHALTSLYTFESDTLVGGTGEIRSWIAMAGAVGALPAEVIDYVPLHHAVTGLGFAVWAPHEPSYN